MTFIDDQARAAAIGLLVGGIALAFLSAAMLVAYAWSGG